MMPASWYQLMMGEDNTVASPFLAIDSDLLGVKSYDLEIGKRVDNWPASAFLRSDGILNDGEPDDLLGNALGLPIMSKRLQVALAESEIGSRDIQFLPIRVLRSDGTDLPGFSIANITTRVPALNREHCSDLDEDDEEIDPLTGMPTVCSFWDAALNKAPLKGHDVIRLTEFFPSIFVSARFADVFRRGRFTGATFDPVKVI